jgi:hypothetical protein
VNGAWRSKDYKLAHSNKFMRKGLMLIIGGLIIFIIIYLLFFNNVSDDNVEINFNNVSDDNVEINYSLVADICNGNSTENEIADYFVENCMGEVYQCGKYLKVVANGDCLADGPDVMFSMKGERAAVCGGLPRRVNIADSSLCKIQCNSNSLCSKI